MPCRQGRARRDSPDGIVEAEEVAAMKKKLFVLMLTAGLFSSFLPPVSAKGLPIKDPKVLFELGQKLVSKGDDGIIAVARIARAMTFAEGAEWEKAIGELHALDGEVKDPEVLFVTNTLKIIVLKRAKTPKEAYLKELEKIIDGAKARRPR